MIDRRKMLQTGLAVIAATAVPAVAFASDHQIRMLVRCERGMATYQWCRIATIATPSRAQYAVDCIRDLVDKLDYIHARFGLSKEFYISEFGYWRLWRGAMVGPIRNGHSHIIGAPLWFPHSGGLTRVQREWLWGAA